MRRFRVRGGVVLTVLGIATVVMLVLAIQKQSSLSTGPGTAAAATPPPAPPSVAFVADGYTSGSPAGGLGPANYTALLASRDGWRVTNPAVYGSGYVAGAPLGDQVAKVAGARPQLVVVSGGRADLDEDPSAVGAAAGRLYEDLKSRLPQATIVVIGPMWIGDDVPQDMRDVRDAIRDSAAAAKLPFVDPLEERWFVGRDREGLTPDGANLNDRGHQRLADLVDETLRRNGTMPT